MTVPWPWAQSQNVLDLGHSSDLLLLLLLLLSISRAVSITKLEMSWFPSLPKAAFSQGPHLHDSVTEFMHPMHLQAEPGAWLTRSTLAGETSNGLRRTWRCTSLLWLDGTE